VVLSVELTRPPSDRRAV